MGGGPATFHPWSGWGLWHRFPARTTDYGHMEPLQSRRCICAGWILGAVARYYNDIRIQRSLAKDAPVSRPIDQAASITSLAIVGRRHNHYARVYVFGPDRPRFKVPTQRGHLHLYWCGSSREPEEEIVAGLSLDGLASLMSVNDAASCFR